MTDAGDGRTPWIFAIRTRLFVALALLAALLTLSLSIWIEREASRQLEDELTAKLHAVGGAAVVLLKPDLVPGLLRFTPALKGFGTYQDARRNLLVLQQLTGVRRIFLADLDGHSFVDTDSTATIGTALPTLRFHRAVFDKVAAGEPSAVPLFTDVDGQIKKTGYVPVRTRSGEVVAVVGVEADAVFLGAARLLRARILGVGAAGLILALILAAFLARGLTRPLERLVVWARRLGSGDLSHPVPVEGRDEIGVLGLTLEQMRVHLESQDRELRAMVAGVAHEIRNPLAGIKLYADLLASDAALAESQRTRVEKVRREMDQLARIVDEFLLFARPAHPSPESIDLLHVIEEVIGVMGPRAASRAVSLEMVPGPQSCPVHFDPTHLRQVLQNLIGNGLEAVEPGGTVRITWRSESQVQVDVEDDGPGISAEVRERIFEPFFTTKPTGAGLGLPIVQRLALLNQARLEVGRSDLGGTRMRLGMPRGRAT
ncbi:MAG: HAMP domain-containing protein [Candidatus Eisenbacteria bacterium]|uniref:histidine kinase n=1 Tax=Eiseniibacteriota bacterium TaxID=2212470 RepID=A0A956M116_UNCEI|nr:HAMP domain-containing protein [Candidatus Eisenbacteria bacterium]